MVVWPSPSTALPARRSNAPDVNSLEARAETGTTWGGMTAAGPSKASTSFSPV
jgi:hypothetical protein